MTDTAYRLIPALVAALPAAVALLVLLWRRQECPLCQGHGSLFDGTPCPHYLGELQRLKGEHAWN